MYIKYNPTIFSIYIEKTNVKYHIFIVIKKKLTVYNYDNKYSCKQHNYFHTFYDSTLLSYLFNYEIKTYIYTDYKDAMRTYYAGYFSYILYVLNEFLRYLIYIC